MRVCLYILGVFGTAFTIMKLAEIGAIATWSWVWVLSPFWLPFAVILTFSALVWMLIVMLAVAFVYTVVTTSEKFEK